ncbi:TPA: zinc metalloprotease HtpX [Candidatus Uhrbacteria bacterium]|nr:zinc metalloprotease HtpX [Candidatus Uhrbacteria bacterium]
MYSAIAANKRQTWLLIIVASAILVGLIWLLGRMYGLATTDSLIIGTVLATSFSLFSYFFSSSIALSVSGAKEISKAQAPDLYNLVENLTIASGLPMPRIYVIDDVSPNAFATGRDPEHAAITFTTGILALLAKNELEGVAAHELSHIKNYDIRVMTIVVVLIGAIMLVADVMLRSTFFRRRGNSENSGGNALLIIGLVLAILSPLFAQLIKFAISRRREYLADSSSALLTRYPAGLASALQKISGVAQPLRTANRATAHLFIANPFGSHTTRGWFANLFSTHPPVADRIARLNEMIK